MKHRHWFVWIGLACAACGDSSSEQPPPPDSAPDGSLSDAPPGSIRFQGSIVGPAPAEARTIGAWDVELGPDHLSKFGDGKATASAFDLVFAMDSAPEDALNTEGEARWAVGVPVLVNASEQLPDGPIIKEFPILGLSTQYAIIYRTGLDVQEGSMFTWVNAFPSGHLTCGKCVKSSTAGIPDSYKLVQCSELVLDAASDPATLHGCDWI